MRSVVRGRVIKRGDMLESGVHCGEGGNRQRCAWPNTMTRRSVKRRGAHEGQRWKRGVAWETDLIFSAAS